MTEAQVPPIIPNQENTTKTKKRKPKIWIILIIILGLMVMCGVIGRLGSKENSNSEKSSATEATSALAGETKTVEPTQTQAPTKTPDPDLVKNGTYLVGTEIKPGIYKGMESGCYWERLKDLSGTFDSIIANSNSNGQFYVEVRESDFAFSTMCNVVLLDPLPSNPSEYPSQITAGEYLIGPDIAPGIYKGNEDGCYWERLKDFYGNFDSIISNDNTVGQFYIEVKPTDLALSISCNASIFDINAGHSGSYPTTLEPGTYLVGLDIQPGTYKGNSDGCYWERLKDLTGGFQSIIANDNTNGQFYIKVGNTDFALSTSCNVERISD